MKDWEQWAWDTLIKILIFLVGFNMFIWAISDG